MDDYVGERFRRSVHIVHNLCIHVTMRNILYTKSSIMYFTDVVESYLWINGWEYVMAVGGRTNASFMFLLFN